MKRDRAVTFFFLAVAFAFNSTAFVLPKDEHPKNLIVSHSDNATEEQQGTFLFAYYSNTLKGYCDPQTFSKIYLGTSLGLAFLGGALFALYEFRRPHKGLFDCSYPAPLNFLLGAIIGTAVNGLVQGIFSFVYYNRCRQFHILEN